MKFEYWKECENDPALYGEYCAKVIRMLMDKGFNEEILKERIERSKEDYGDEFFWTVYNYPDDLDEWAEKYDLSDKATARNFVLMCLDFE